MHSRCRLRQWYHTHMYHCHKRRDAQYRWYCSCRNQKLLNNLTMSNSIHIPYSYSHYLSAALVNFTKLTYLLPLHTGLC